MYDLYDFATKMVFYTIKAYGQSASDFRKVTQPIVLAHLRLDEWGSFGDERRLRVIPVEQRSP